MPQTVYVATMEVKLTIRAGSLQAAEDKAKAIVRTLDNLYSSRVMEIGEYVPLNHLK